MSKLFLAQRPQIEFGLLGCCLWTDCHSLRQNANNHIKRELGKINDVLKFLIHSECFLIIYRRACWAAQRVKTWTVVWKAIGGRRAFPGCAHRRGGEGRCVESRVLCLRSCCVCSRCLCVALEHLPPMIWVSSPVFSLPPNALEFKYSLYT